MDTDIKMGTVQPLQARKTDVKTMMMMIQMMVECKVSFIVLFNA